MSGACRRRRGTVAAQLAAALCSVVTLLTDLSPAAGSSPAADGASGSPGVPLTLSAGDLGLSTGLVHADLSHGANGPIVLTVGPCVPLLGTSCSGVLSEFSLLGDFKDAAGNPLYADSAPASVSWTCNATVCPPAAGFLPGSSTLTQLQVQEFLAHTIYVSLKNPDGTFQPYAPAPACNGTTGAPLPTGTLDRQDTGGLGFCVDVGAIGRGGAQCQTACSSWSGPLTLPVLFVEDPKFMAT